MTYLTPTSITSIGLALILAACTAPQKSVTFSALTDTRFDAASGLYIDEDRKALAIDAAQANFRNMMIGATLNSATLVHTGTYTLHLTVLTEIDGESEYVISIGDKSLAKQSAPESNSDYSPVVLKWDKVSIQSEEAITVKASAVTNGKIPEGDGTAYSRGRWTALTLTPAN